jgi:hypothetical protein
MVVQGFHGVLLSEKRSQNPSGLLQGKPKTEKLQHLRRKVSATDTATPISLLPAGRANAIMAATKSDPAHRNLPKEP